MPTPAQNKANHKYRAKAYDQIAVSVPKGKRDIYRAQAAAHGMSLNSYIVSLLDEDAARLPIDSKVCEGIPSPREEM